MVIGEWLRADPGAQRQMAMQCGIVSAAPGVAAVPLRRLYRLAEAVAAATAEVALAYLRAAAGQGGVTAPYEPQRPPRA